MMDFLYAAELKKRFSCYGHFYELLLMNGDRINCRSVLEIVDGSISQERPSVISGLQPDVVAIMMNPGSSHPKDIYHMDQEIEYPQDHAPLHKELVLTQPDNTQYQIMRVAAEKGWHHIRVLNLSDLRDPKSGDFLRKVEELAGVMGGHTHSMFCRERMDECAQSIRRKGNSPILLGWGQDTGLIPLAEQCLGRLGGEVLCTVPSEVHPLLNAHPSPMLQAKKLEWLDRILMELG